MLKKLSKAKVRAGGGRYAIVASRYNGRYVDAMLKAARRELEAAKAAEIKVVRVPGAFEIPVAATALCRQSGRWTAVICLGVIIRGETAHAQLIGEAVSQQLAGIAVSSGVPMIHEVLLLENKEQAVKRCLDPEHNRGAEAARSALEMGRVMEEL